MEFVSKYKDIIFSFDLDRCFAVIACLCSLDLGGRCDCVIISVYIIIFCFVSFFFVFFFRLHVYACTL